MLAGSSRRWQGGDASAHSRGAQQSVPQRLQRSFSPVAQAVALPPIFRLRLLDDGPGMDSFFTRPANLT